MKLLSLNVGRPQEFNWMGKTVLTSIFKYPVSDQRKVSFLNIEGDEQSDLNVHGGIGKAVYAYDISHYDHCKKFCKETIGNPECLERILQLLACRMMK